MKNYREHLCENRENCTKYSFRHIIILLYDYRSFFFYFYSYYQYSAVFPNNNLHITLSSVSITYDIFKYYLKIYRLNDVVGGYSDNRWNVTNFNILLKHHKDLEFWNLENKTSQISIILDNTYNINCFLYSKVNKEQLLFITSELWIFLVKSFFQNIIEFIYENRLLVKIVFTKFLFLTDFKKKVVLN